MTWPRVKPGKGCARILDLLGDGSWHSSYELQVGLGVMAHSRLPELRKAGYVIEKRRIDGATGLHQFEWRLLSSPLAESASVSSAPHRGALSSAADDGYRAGSASGAAGQKVLEGLTAFGEASGAGNEPVADAAPPYPVTEAGQLALLAA